MMEPPPLEKAVGIECYATGGGPCVGTAKASPEDFRVEELIETEGVVSEWRPGRYPLYRVEKRSVDTMHMARDLAARLGSRVSFGGMKDSRAVAVQYVTPASLRSDRPARVAGSRYTASLVGYVQRPISRSAVLANKFHVVLRNCCPDIGARVADTMRSAEKKELPNYFGLQRFGTSGPGTHAVGKALVQGDVERAVWLLVGENGKGSAETPLPPGKDIEKMVKRELSRHPGEWTKALRAVPVRLRRLYVQAYQSLLFNKTLSRAMKKGEVISAYEEGDNWSEASPDGLVLSRARGVREKPGPGAVPLVQIVGYAYRDYGSRFDACVAEALEDEGVAPGQFYVGAMPEVSAEGGFRRPHLAVKDASCRSEAGTAELSFTLARGEYATVLLREVLKPPDPALSGLA